MPQLTEWIRNTPPGAIVEHGMFTRSADSIEAFAEQGWGKGRVTFVGDAVHATRPTGKPCSPCSHVLRSSMLSGRTTLQLWP